MRIIETPVEKEQPSKLEYYLDLWSAYMRSSGLRKMWYPGQSAGFNHNSSRAYDEVSEIIEDSVSSYEIGVMKGAMDSLPTINRISLEFEYINKKAGAHVFSHPMLPGSFPLRVQLLEESKEKLAAILIRKGLYL